MDIKDAPKDRLVAALEAVLRECDVAESNAQSFASVASVSPDGIRLAITEALREEA